MDINFKDEEVVAKPDVPPELITKLLTKLSHETMVSRDTIISLEAQLGKGSIPNKIKNSVTSTASKQGYNALVSHMRSLVCSRDTSTIIDVLTAAYDYCTVLSNMDIHKIIKVLEDDLELLSNLYVPKSVRTGVYTDEGVVTKLRLGSVIDGTLGARTFQTIKSPTLRYLSRKTNCVPYGSLRILIDVLTNGPLEFIRPKSTTLAYNGTVEEFIRDNIADLITLSDMDLREGCAAIATILDEYAMAEGHAYTFVVDIIEEYTKVFRNDGLIKSFASSC